MENENLTEGERHALRIGYYQGEGDVENPPDLGHKVLRVLDAALARAESAERDTKDVQAELRTIRSFWAGDADLLTAAQHSAAQWKARAEAAERRARQWEQVAKADPAHKRGAFNEQKWADKCAELARAESEAATLRSDLERMNKSAARWERRNGDLDADNAALRAEVERLNALGSHAADLKCLRVTQTRPRRR